MRRLILALFFVLFTTSIAKATDIYFAQSAAGGGTGLVSCANARALSSHVIGDDVADNILHFCGAFTGGAGATLFTTLASGTSGHPITIKFESGATAKAPYWSANGAIRINHNYWTVIGTTTCGHVNDTTNTECTEFIQNTQDGISGQNICPAGACTFQQNSVGVFLNGCTGCEVKNLGIFDLYDRVANTTDLNQFGITVDILGGSSAHIHNLHVTNSANGPAFVGTGTQSGIEFDHLWIQGAHVSMQVGDDNAAARTMSGINIHDNDMGGASIWDATSGGSHIHNDGTHLFCTFTGCSLSANFYNNIVHGDNGLFYTAFANPEGGAGVTVSVCAFNNVFVGEGSGAPAVAGLDFKGAKSSCAYNNTFVMTTGGTALMQNVSTTNTTIENNLTSCAACTYTTSDASETGQVWDYNLYWSSTGSHFFYGGAFYNWNTGSSWQGTLGFDAHGQAGNNPLLSPTFALQTGSAAIGAGKNLFTICNGQPNPGLGALCNDKAGNARPTVAVWDQGAYSFVSGISIPAIPTGLTASVAGSSVNLNWTQSTGTPAGYNILRATVNGGPYSFLATVTGVTSYTDAGRPNGTYYYVVNAFNSAGTSANSSQASAVVATACSINLTPPSLAFGSVTQGTPSATQSVTVTNMGTATCSSLVVANPSGPNGADFGQTNSCGGSLAVNATCLVTYTFTPSIAGTLEQASGAVTSNDPNSPDTVTLTGTGSSAVVLNPAVITLANTYTTHTSATAVLTYTNQSGSSITVSSIVFSTGDAVMFSETDNCIGTVTNGSSCTINITFTPTSNGNKTTNLVITDSAAGSPRTVVVSGRASGHGIIRIGVAI